ncbi:hypothetical protein [Polaromonas sp.]|uniref:hypothetical protein n=1 Tax=Polaromonas sp. TaxID=1869339 RepID=UPI00352B87B7
MKSTQIYPVIHYLDRDTAIAETAIARRAGADGVFLISHLGDDVELVDVAKEIRLLNAGFPVGVNLLSRQGLAAVQIAVSAGMDMVWADNMGVDSTGLTAEGRAIAAIAMEQTNCKIFASVAFKYRPHEPLPESAAKHAQNAGLVPTTSGSATGSAPEVQKISVMSAATGGLLAVASGMTPENVGSYAPYLSHILVATGVSLNEHQLDDEKLRAFIAKVRASDARAPAG